jgi:hypothetical protein
MLLSIDWDAFSGCSPLVFDAPIWGTPDRAADRLERWQQRALKRDPQAQNWSVLDKDFPLYPGWEALEQYAGRPASVAWSHAHAWAWLERYPGRPVLNIDSHHDLYSGSGDPGSVRPGNWAGLGLRAGLIETYTVQYPNWHTELAVAEGYDLARTGEEVQAQLETELLSRLELRRSDTLPPPAEVEAVLFVQSPSWCSPAHDAAFESLIGGLNGEILSAPYLRPWPPH